jgi:hypothetical protein
VGDGGLDVVIENATPVSEDVIPSGVSGFQIKSSDLQPAECKRELYSNGNLKSGIKRVLDKNGVYVLVLFVDMPSETMKGDRKNAIMEELLKLGYTSPKIRIYTINQMIGFAERFPGLVSSLKGYPIECIPYQIWANHKDVSDPKTFVLDDQRKNIINEIRETLRNSDGRSRIFRIAGLSGLGKTRLAFEALSPDDLKNTVLYTTAEGVKNSSLQNTLLVDESMHAIMVVDECSLEDHDYFANRFCNQGSRLALITISNEGNPVPLPTIYYQLNPLQESDIEKLLAQESEGLPQNVTRRLAELAEGYPSFALFLLKNYISSSATQDILNIEEILIRKLIAGGIDPKTDWFRTTKYALMALALFERVGFKGELASEAQYAAGLVGVDWDEFQKVVKEQKQQGTITGEYYIWVTPFPLAVHLFREWWEIYGDSKVEELIKSMPEVMLDRFVSRLPFVTPKSGRRLVERLLSGEGIFADGSLLKTERGSNFFLKLTEADPQAALNCLKRTIGIWNKQQLLEFRTGRRQIVWSLEKIAVWRELFADAARLLLALGEAENESYANNSSGVFAELFSPAWGPVAPTEASLEERFHVLVEAIGSESLERKRLALNAFRSALQSRYFSRMIGAEYQGSKPIPKLWTPKNSDEVLEHYRRVWTFLEENLEKFENGIRNNALQVLSASVRDLASVHPSLSEMTRKTIRKVSVYPWIDRSKLVEVVSNIVHYDGKKMPENVLRDWVTLRDDLIGSGFSDLLKRYVEMDFLEDYFQNTEKYDDKWIQSKLRGLAEKVIENPSFLDPEYSWLTTEKARRGYQFGYQLGVLDKDFSFLDKILEQQKKTVSNGSLGFMGGYFRALFEKNVALWENKLDLLSEDNSFKKHIPELTWRSGITDKAAKRILSMLQKGDITVDSLGTFKYGGVIQKISEATFADWASFILTEQFGVGATLLLNLVHSYYVYSGDKPIQKDIALKTLLQPGLWDKPKNLGRDPMVEYYWKEVALKLINTFSETSGTIAEQVLKFFGAENSIFDGFRSEAISEVLLEITKKDPKEVWQKLINYLGPPMDRRAFHLMQWLRGEFGFEMNIGALGFFDVEDVWKWVDEKPEERARFLAHCVSPILFHSSDKMCLAREMLARYGDRDDVRSSFSSNYSTEGWTGPASTHYMSKKNALLDFKKEEKDGNVLRWIDEYLEILEKDIERAKMAEEKGEF